MLTGEQIRNLAGGTIFSAEFVKKDGTVRNMVCRLNVKNRLKGGVRAYDPASKGLLTVFDMQKRAYRNINLYTLRSAKIRGKVYK